MKGRIRKVSVGVDFPNNVIHYIIGQKYNVGGKQVEINNIIWDREMTQLTGDNTFHITVLTDDGATVSWKTISKMAIQVEYDLAFE